MPDASGTASTASTAWITEITVRIRPLKLGSNNLAFPRRALHRADPAIATCSRRVCHGRVAPRKARSGELYLRGEPPREGPGGGTQARSCSCAGAIHAFALTALHWLHARGKRGATWISRCLAKGVTAKYGQKGADSGSTAFVVTV